MYIQIYVFMNMYVQATYNLSSIFQVMYMYIACTYMFRIVCNLVNMYRHVCTMFSNVRTVLPILVQVVRIPDAYWSYICTPDFADASNTVINMKLVYTSIYSRRKLILVYTWLSHDKQVYHDLNMYIQR